MASHTYKVSAEWDEEAQGWLVTSADIPGLVTGGATVGEIVDKLRLVIPALIEVGVEPQDEVEIRFRLKGARLPANSQLPREVERVKLAA